MRRVVHRGAELIAPADTPATLDAALDAGVDMIELDVLAERPDGSGRLILAHDHRSARREPLSLKDGLARLANEDLAGVDLNLDLKLPGYELRALAALREAGLLRRTMVSSTYRASLDVLRAAEPHLRLAWSFPRARRDYTALPWTAAPALAVVQGYRVALPRLARSMLAAGRCDAIMAYWRLVTPALARTVAAAGGELYAWTVDDPRRIERLEALGVTGVVADDPALFGR
jgi:glycerophosphoryl diester phosphodiesterase